MIRYKATNKYAHFGEVHLINGKGYALRWEIDNSAPCGHCALFNNITTDTEKMCMHPDKDKRMCKHESGTSKGWNTYEYVHIPDGNFIPDEQSIEWMQKLDVMKAEQNSELEMLRHYYNSTKGLYCIDRDPNEVDIEWIRENAFRLD